MLHFPAAEMHMAIKRFAALCCHNLCLWSTCQTHHYLVVAASFTTVPKQLKDSPAWHTAVPCINSNVHDGLSVDCNGNTVGTVMTCHAMQAMWPPDS